MCSVTDVCFRCDLSSWQKWISWLSDCGQPLLSVSTIATLSTWQLSNSWLSVGGLSLVVFSWRNVIRLTARLWSATGSALIATVLTWWQSDSLLPQCCMSLAHISMMTLLSGWLSDRGQPLASVSITTLSTWWQSVDCKYVVGHWFLGFMVTLWSG
jgi:hypothetical protein